MLSLVTKNVIEANRRPAKNYRRDAFMARGPRGKVSLPEAFREPSRNLPGNFVTWHPFYNLWLITFGANGKPTEFLMVPFHGSILLLPGTFRVASGSFRNAGTMHYWEEEYNKEIIMTDYFSSGVLPGTFRELPGTQENIMLKITRMPPILKCF